MIMLMNLFETSPSKFYGYRECFSGVTVLVDTYYAFFECVLVRKKIKIIVECLIFFFFYKADSSRIYIKKKRKKEKPR